MRADPRRLDVRGHAATPLQRDEAGRDDETRLGPEYVELGS
jgi:hypothetical protein